jgi:transcriptional regulator of NAD metabolism
MTKDERRIKILEILKNSDQPISGTMFAKKFNVSRQIIVQDISLLKASNHAIISTAQGYVFIKSSEKEVAKKVVAVCHTPEQTEHELKILVNIGVTVVDVRVEHPIYGEVIGKLLLKNLEQVDIFINRLKTTGAKLISELTHGIHLHTLEAEDPFKLLEAEKALKKAGYLIE